MVGAMVGSMGDSQDVGMYEEDFLFFCVGRSTVALLREGKLSAVAIFEYSRNFEFKLPAN